MATINQQKLVENLTKSVINVLQAQNEAVIIGMNVLRADMIDRIFLNGLDSSNAQIGKYSNKPMYASLNQPSQIRASSLKGRGKSSKKGQKNQSKFNNGKDRKSMYLPGGYAEFRAVVGRQNQKVDLMLTGSLKGDIRTGVRDKDRMGGSIELSFTTDKQVEIAEGNENRFNKTIFAASDAELDSLTLNWEQAVTDAFFKSFE